MSAENILSLTGSVCRPVFSVCFGGAIALLLVGCASPPPVEPVEEPVVKEQPAEVAAAISPEKSFDHRPYEFIWYEPKEEHPPLVDFDRPRGWTVTTDPGCVAEFERTQEEQLWGSFVGKIVYGGSNTTARATIHPPQPIPIREHFDTVTMWIHAGVGSNRATNVELALLVRDGADNELTFSFGPVDWDGWRLCYVRPHDEDLADLEQPCFLVGLEVRHGASPSTHTLYVDSLAFFNERMMPLPMDSQRPLKLDVPAAEDALPFPVDGLSVVPEFDTNAVRTTVSELSSDHYVLGSRSAAGVLEYHVLVTNQLPLVRSVFDGIPVGDWFVGGGIHGIEEMHGDLVVSRVERDAVHLQYSSGATYVFGVAGMSLLIDSSCRAGVARYVDSGHYRGSLDWHPLHLPDMAGQDTPVLLGWLDLPKANGDEEASTPSLFFSQTIDWYRSLSSEVRSVPADPTHPGHLRALYHERTNATRSDVRERFVFTLSPVVQDVFPSIPNPVGQRLDDLRSRVWAGVDGLPTYDDLQDDIKGVSALGITNVVRGFPEAIWQGVGENATLRVRATPELGGNEALQNLLRIHSLAGWLSGLQVNYLEISALNRFWSSDVVLRDQRNRWRQMLSGRYGVKPGFSLAFQSKILPVLQNLFSPSLSYLGSLTAQPPWVMTDYDERAEQAGSFVLAYGCLGEILIEERAQLQAAVVGDSGGEMFYAGLADGFVDTGKRNLVESPYLPLYSLYRLQPLSVRYGVGPIQQVTASDTGGPTDVVQALDRYLAAQIAYGHCGRLVPTTWGDRLQMRSYFMMQKLQSHIAGQRVERVAYWDGERYVTASQALVSDTWKDSRLYANYTGGVEVWVNGNRRDDWEVRVGRDVWTLPPYGWVVFGPDLFETSVLINGRRMDYVRSSEWIYADGRGSDQSAFGIASSSPVLVTLVREKEKTQVDVLVPMAPERVGLGNVFDLPGSLGVATVFNRAGTSFDTVDAEVDDHGMMWYILPPDTWRLRIVCNPPAVEEQGSGVLPDVVRPSHAL